MARWKLITNHQLNVYTKDGGPNEWEYKEVDRMTGREMRRRVQVPLLFDINDMYQWNDNVIRSPRGDILGGDIVVAHKTGLEKSTDYIFTGDPTPDMLPLDAEAEAISAKFSDLWRFGPNEDKPYVQNMMEDVQAEQAKIAAENRKVTVEGMPEMMAAMMEMMKQNQALIATLTSLVPKPTERRI